MKLAINNSDLKIWRRVIPVSSVDCLNFWQNKLLTLDYCSIVTFYLSKYILN